MKQFFNIVLPMAGRGSRFRQQGYKDSKPFIDVEGRPMIQRVVENLNIEFDKNFKFIILCQEADYLDYDFSIFNKMIGHDNIEIVKSSPIVVINIPSDKSSNLTFASATTCVAKVDSRIAVSISLTAT